MKYRFKKHQRVRRTELKWIKLTINAKKKYSQNVWEHRVLIHEGQTATSQPAGTLSEAGCFPEKHLAEKQP